MLKFCARHGRPVLAASLVVGLLSTTLAALIKPHIDLFIMFLLFAACLRVGPHQMIGAISDLKSSLVFTVALQIFLPLSIICLARLAGIDHNLVFALALLTAAPALSGSPHLVTLMGFDPAPALRQLVIGTGLLPLTILPVFVFLPQLGNLGDLIGASLRLLVTISLAAVFAFTIRLTVMKNPTDDHLTQVDGASTILLAIVVVGLMAALHEEILANPLNVLTTLAVAFLANFGLQIITSTNLSKSKFASYSVPIGVIAGNRNVALFLVALPPATAQPLLLFIACYQIPMYLTPVIMKRFYQRF